MSSPHKDPKPASPSLEGTEDFEPPTAATFGMVPLREALPSTDYDYQVTSPNSPYFGLTNPQAAHEAARRLRALSMSSQDTSLHPSSLAPSPYPGDPGSDNPADPSYNRSIFGSLAGPAASFCTDDQLGLYEFEGKGFQAAGDKYAPLQKCKACECDEDTIHCMAHSLTALVYRSDQDKDTKTKSAHHAGSQEIEWEVTVIDGTEPWKIEPHTDITCIQVERLLQKSLNAHVESTGVSPSTVLEAVGLIQTALSAADVQAQLKGLTDTVRMPLQVMPWCQTEMTDDPSKHDPAAFVGRLARAREDFPL